jgi:hypothetical protein
MASSKIFVTNPVITGMIVPNPHLGFSGPIKSTSSGFVPPPNNFQSPLLSEKDPTSAINFNSPYPMSMRASFSAKPYNDSKRYVKGNNLPEVMPPLAQW